MSILGIFKKKDPLEGLKLDEPFQVPREERTDYLGMDRKLNLPEQPNFFQNSEPNPRMDYRETNLRDAKGHELELINAKLEAINAKLDNLINRLNSLESKDRSVRW